LWREGKHMNTYVGYKGFLILVEMTKERHIDDFTTITAKCKDIGYEYPMFCHSKHNQSATFTIAIDKVKCAIDKHLAKLAIT